MPDRIVDIWGTRTPYARGEQWPVRVDQTLADGLGEEDVDRWVQSACVLCSNGCALDIAVKDGAMVGVRGRAQDAVNRGRLGPKGLHASWQGVAHRDRLTRPLVREDGRLVESDWDTAMGRIVSRSRSLLADRGPTSHGFYTSGQLFLEEYYALGILTKAGIGTPHVDGNTRLCTATAATAMKESFGSDGQPGCYRDVDECDALFLYGHNMAETQTVLWSRVLDRLEGPDRPKLVCVDPRVTEVARRADVHLAVRPGTNLALMHGLAREIVAQGWVDEEYVAAHTLHVGDLAQHMDRWTPEAVARECGVAAEDVREAARIFGTSSRVVSTVLQGFYQSAQATASACQVNNLHLLRGMLGRPGCAVLQMNGQPTAQNAREAGANGDLPGFRNWANAEHIAQLAALWDVDPDRIPHDGPPTHALQIFEEAEQGNVELLWIAATNPAVSLPQLPRVRDIIAAQDLFVVVQDLYLTETARYADVVLPAAAWGEKTGTFTNADRTVHLSEQAVAPPGQARSDLDIFLDYARRMGFRTRSGEPLLDWSGPEDGFNAWRECSRGRPCDYTGLSYEMLRGGSGVQWPVNAEHPEGTPRLHTDGRFPTRAEEAESYGHDLHTGESVSEDAYRAMAPDGRAQFKTAPYEGPSASTTGEHPLRLATGRTAYHFHTRTKTGRTPALDEAAPRVWVEMSAADCERLGLQEGDVVRVDSEHGHVTAPVRVGEVREGTVFAPFHYGSGQHGTTPPARPAAPAHHSDDFGRHSAANELTHTELDPVSHQPVFKNTPVRVTKVADATGPAPAPTTTASRPAGGGDDDASVRGATGTR